MNFFFPNKMVYLWYLCLLYNKTLGYFKGFLELFYDLYIIELLMKHTTLKYIYTQLLPDDTQFFIFIFITRSIRGQH